MDTQIVNQNYTQIINTFFCHLQNALRQLDDTLDTDIKYSISKKLFSTMDIHVGYDALAPALLKVFAPTNVNERETVLVPQPEVLEKNFWQKAWRRIGGQKRRVDNTAMMSVVVDPQVAFEDHLSQLSEMTAIEQNGILASIFLDLIATASDKQLRLLSEAVVTVKHYQLETSRKNVEEFNQVTGKKCIIVNGLFTPSWAPAFQALQEHGWAFAALVCSDLKLYTGYGALVTEKIPTPYKYVADLVGGLIFMSHLHESAIFLSGEAYQFVNWDAENALILYALMGSVARTIRVFQKDGKDRLHYFMYDGLKPVSVNAPPLKDALSTFYKYYLQSANKIIYNSNRAVFGTFTENTYDIQAKRLHFLRYSEEPKNPKPRLSFGPNHDEYHMVCITGCLDGSIDALRSTVTQLVRTIIHQGIHFHYYNGDPDPIIKAFTNTIAPSYRKFFHSYPVNTNQAALVNELHQYHIGLNPSDYLLMSDAITAVSDRKHQDAMQRFIESTFPTSYLTYIASGLPVLSTLDPSHLLYETMLFMTPSEFGNLKNYLKKINLPEYCKKADELRQVAWAKNHIHELIDFMEC